MAGTSLWRMGLTLGVLASLFYAATGRAGQPKVLLAVRSDDMFSPDVSITRELVVMLDMLKKAGFTPVVASEDGAPFVSGRTKVETDLKFTKVAISEYVAVLMPCMTNPAGGTIAPALVKVVNDAAAAGKLIAAQRSAIYILSVAGLLKGRKYAYAQPAFPEGIYAGDGVVQDGNIITSAICPYDAQMKGKSDGTVQLMEMLIRALKAS